MTGTRFCCKARQIVLYCLSVDLWYVQGRNGRYVEYDWSVGLKFVLSLCWCWLAGYKYYVILICREVLWPRIHYLGCAAGVCSLSRSITSHDCTFKESLFSTHSNLTIQIRNQSSLWWHGKAQSDPARRSAFNWKQLKLWRRAALRTHSLLMPDCALWTGPPPPPSPPHYQNTTPPKNNPPKWKALKPIPQSLLQETSMIYSLNIDILWYSALTNTINIQ